MRPKRFLTFLLAAIVGLLYLGAIAQHAHAGGYGNQAVIVQEYVVQPQLVQSYVQQQNAACAVQQFNAYSAPLVQRQIVRQKVVQQKFVQPQRFRSVQRVRGGGNFSSITIQRQRSGGGFLRNLLPF